jgi:hypothetical protein
MATSITDWNDLDNVRNNPSGDYILENNLDSSTAGFSGIGDSWTPLDISGNFNGNGYYIRDWTTVTDAGGFFGEVSGTVEYLELSYGDVVGGDQFYGVGGFARRVTSSGTIQYCSSGLYLNVETTDRTSVAGMVARNLGLIQDCYSIATVTKSGNDADVSGLVNRNDGTIERCYAAGVWDQTTGGSTFATVAESNTENALYWCTDCIGAPSTGVGTGLTESQMSGSNAVTNMPEFDFNDVWQEEFGDTPTLRDPAPPIVTVDLSATGNATGNSEPTQVVVPRSFAATASASGTAQTVGFRRRRLFGATADATGVSASPVLSRRRSVGATATASAIGDAILDVQNPYTDLSATGSASGTSDATIERTRGFTASGAGAASADATVGRRRGLDATGSGAATAESSVSRTRPLSASGSGSGDGTALFVLVRDGRGVVSPRRNRVIRVTPRQYAELLSSRVNTALDTDTIETGGN